MTACNDQKYQALATQSTYPNKRTFRQAKEFCVIARKLKRTSCIEPKRYPE